MANYYTEDFETYSDLFRLHSSKVARLMSTLGGYLPSGVTPRELYKMTRDIMYNVDDDYRKETGKEDNLSTLLYPYMSKDEVWTEMRTMLQQELDRYFNGQNK